MQLARDAGRAGEVMLGEIGNNVGRDLMRAADVEAHDEDGWTEAREGSEEMELTGEEVFNMSAGYRAIELDEQGYIPSPLQQTK